MLNIFLLKQAIGEFPVGYGFTPILPVEQRLSVQLNSQTEASYPEV